MSELVQVKVVGIGVNTTVTIEANTPAADAIAEARGAAASSGELQARVNGEKVDAATFVPSDGDTIVLVPPDVKLGQLVTA